MSNEKKFVKQAFVFDKETLPIGMPYAITNKESNGNEFFALLQNVSPDLLVFKVIDVTGDEYDYPISVNSYVDEKVVIKGPLCMTHYIDDPEGEWKLREVPECNKIEVTSEMLFGRNVGIVSDEAKVSVVNDHSKSQVYVVMHEGDSLSNAYYQAYRPDGTIDENYELPVGTGFWIVPSEDPKYKGFVFDVCSRKWPLKILPKEEK